MKVFRNQPPSWASITSSCLHFSPPFWVRTIFRIYLVILEASSVGGGISWFEGRTFARMKARVSTYFEEPQERIHKGPIKEWDLELVVFKSPWVLSLPFWTRTLWECHDNLKLVNDAIWTMNRLTDLFGPLLKSFTLK